MLKAVTQEDQVELNTYQEGAKIVENPEGEMAAKEEEGTMVDNKEVENQEFNNQEVKNQKLNNQEVQN